MNSYCLTSPAKINLYLEIVGDRPDGFHELATIFQSLSLADRVILKSAPGGVIRVRCNVPAVPTNEHNLAHRAASLMAKTFPQAFHHFGGVEIDLQKEIPMAAGLAGGSGNAAAVLVGLDLAWDLGLTQGELQDLGAQLGSDVSFCVAGGTVLATGRGECLDPLPSLEGIWVVLAKFTGLAISTPWAYQTYRQRFAANYAPDAAARHDRQQRVKSGAMVQAIAHLASLPEGDRPAAARSLTPLLRNDLERVALAEHPALAQLRAVLGELAPLGAMMSGSGPTVFALAESAREAEAIVQAARRRLQGADLGFWITQFSANGIRLEK